MIDVGHNFSTTHAFNVEEVKAFATLAGDDNPLHHDAEFAASTPIGDLIASGTHTSSLMMGAVASHFSGTGGALGVHFSFELLSPVFAHERVTIRWEVTTVMPRRRGGTFVSLTGTLCADDPAPRVQATAKVLIGSSRLEEFYPPRTNSNSQKSE